jgi:hypothetical protein
MRRPNSQPRVRTAAGKNTISAAAATVAIGLVQIMARILSWQVPRDVARETRITIAWTVIVRERR